MSTAPAQPAVFLDRDRTLIEDPGYISDPEQVRLLDGAAESLCRLRDAGYAVVVVTNQSGVARGLLTEGDLAIVHQRMRDLLRAQGADVDGIYYCPFLDGPEAVREQYRRDSSLRKPKPGMLLLAAEELHIDLKSSWMIGDSARDVQAGRAAGCRTILISSEAEEDGTEADSVVTDLLAATERVLAGRTRTVLQGSKPAQSDEHVAAATGGACAGGGDPRSQIGERSITAASASVSPRASRQQPAVTPPCQAGAPDSDARASASKPQGTPAAGSGAIMEERLDGILEELRIMRRERQYEDFSIAKLGGAVFEAFALCAAGWGLYAWMSSGSGPDPERATSATVWLLGAIVFQLMALTCLIASNKK
ncbi:MAG TPA: HAD family hydrolase [Phycisphaerae bacterium]|nr:HAD family hydrolase [Phycisphaerae bacterium]